MPKYNFKCHQCEYTGHRYVPSTVEVLPCPECKEQMQREMPKIDSPTEVREVVDSYTNTKWGKDQLAVVKQRKDDHFWNVEVPRLVQTYSTETCIEEGWLKYNDKGELVINKPPSRR